MELVKGAPYFCDVKQKIKQYPYLDKDISCDILIIGGGVIGAIANYYLSKEFNTVLVDKSRFGLCCSSCSTAILAFNLDNTFTELNKNLSKLDILNIYKMGKRGLLKLDEYINANGNKCHYHKRDVFMYANSIWDNKSVLDEYTFLKKNNYNVKLIEKENNPFEFDITKGILLPKAGAELNTYLLTKQLIEASKNPKYENTNIVEIIEENGEKQAVTTYGNTIRCNKIVFATGFNFDLFSKLPLCDSYLTYSIVTNPLNTFTWKNNALIQDWADPYHYLRRLPDGRIIYGGEDTKFKFGNIINESFTKKKYSLLENNLKKMFPSIAENLKVEYSFCGAFGSTRNNIGYIGEFTNGNYQFLSMGANGIVNAFGVIEDFISSLKGEKPSSVFELFSPLRYEKFKTNI